MKCNHWIATRYTPKGTAKIQFLVDKSVKSLGEALEIFGRFNKTKVEDARRCDGRIKVECTYIYGGDYDDQGGYRFTYVCDKCKTSFQYNMPEEGAMIQSYLDSLP